MRKIMCVLWFCITAFAWGQEPPKSVSDVDPGSETGKLKKSCPFKSVPGCLEVLFTGQPVHIAVGSIAPQNGVAVGLAYVDGHNNVSGNWRNSWNADTVVSPNLSWRAGVYLKFVDSRQPNIGVQKGTAGIGKNKTELPEQPVITVYAQTITLNKLMFFGLGPSSTLAGRSFFGMRETIAGGSLVKPFNDRFHTGVYGEINGRSVDILPPGDGSLPATQSSYTEATAPGLTTQPFFLQFGVGARMRPDFRRLHLNYDLAFRPYIATTDSRFTFSRLTVDLQHQFQLYNRGFPLSRDTNGPDDCSAETTNDPNSPTPVAKRVKSCPIEYSRDKVGTIDVRAFTSLSMLNGSIGAPFYFQPTLGGGDINGTQSLAAYTDYRFRAPNVLLLRESFEHSLGKWPVAFMLSAEQGKVALLKGDLGSNPWIHTFSTGFNVQAGGFPMLSLTFAWGHEGTHILANINNSLLGGSSRPSLF